MTPTEFIEAAKIVESLEVEAENSAFHIKTGEHVRIAEDKIYFSVVGFNASDAEFEEYKAWESTRKSLRTIVRNLQPHFFNFEFKNEGTKLTIEPKKALDKI